jgi:uncharacterized repeat protein (TIGR01451 family)
MSLAVDTRADVGLSVTAGPNPSIAGSFLTYVIKATNDGPSGAIGATLTHALPPGLLITSAAGGSSSCTKTPGLVTCTLPKIGTGESMSVTVVAVPTVAGAISATSTISVVEHDPNPANNVVVATTMVAGPSSALAGLGDFNGDGSLDLAISDPKRDVVHVYFNDGHGRFVEHQQVAVGHNPTGLAVGDVNNDGSLDIVVANREGNSVSILRNDGSGTFRESSRVPTLGDEPSRVALGDFDGDGRLDIAVTNTDSGTVSLLTRDAGGVWIVKARLAVAVRNARHEDDDDRHPLAIAVADLNGDGTLDIAVGNKDPNSVSLLMNNGNWHFAVPREIALRYVDDPNGLAIADFDNDGDLDIAVVGKDRGELALLVNTNGSFVETLVQAPIEDRPVAIAAGDLNGDGLIDLAVAAGDDVATLINAGGVFPLASATNIEAAPKRSIAMVMGDVNGDGTLDIVLVDSKLTISVLVSAQGLVEKPKTDDGQNRQDGQNNREGQKK